MMNRACWIVHEKVHGYVQVSVQGHVGNGHSFGVGEKAALASVRQVAELSRTGNSHLVELPIC